MKTVNRTIGDVFREVGAAATHIGRYFMRTLSRMSWPALLATASPSTAHRFFAGCQDGAARLAARPHPILCAPAVRGKHF